MITEVTIYEKNDKLYCPACKPKGGKKGTFGTSEYDHFCAGCGEDLKEIGEAQEEVAREIFVLRGHGASIQIVTAEITKSLNREEDKHRISAYRQAIQSVRRTS